MGLGKTLQALSVAYFYRHKWPLLIIVPASLKYPWVEEVEKWFPEISPDAINMIYNGSDISGISKAEITIVTYGLLNRPSCRVVQEALMNQGFNFVILDESHYMKNWQTRTTKYLVPLLQKAEHKILLTGTPALSRPIELFPQLDALHKGMFGSHWDFARKYCDGKFIWFAGKKKWYCDGATNLEDLQHRLRQGVMIRRLKKDVLAQLPPKQRQKIPFELKDSKFKSEVDRIYQELKAELEKLHMCIGDVLRPREEYTEIGNPFKMRNLMSQMYRETAKAKIGPVREYVKMLCENKGLKFLIFAYHHNMMDGIAEELHDTNLKYIRIDGHTAAQERPGLTLTAAKVVIFAELDYTPGSLQQCEDRAHRIGQKETVHIHYLVAKGTLDEYIWSMLSRKTTVITTALNGVTQKLQMERGNKGHIQRLSKADAYIPSEKSQDISLSSVFNSPQSSGPKSLLEYFSPSNKKSEHNDTLTKGTKRKSETTGMLKVASNESRNLSSDVIVIDDDLESSSCKRQRLSEELNFSPVTVKREKLSYDEDKKTKRAAATMKNNFIIEKRCKKDVCEIQTGETTIMESQNGAKKYSESKWSCPLCTFLNHSALPYCEMCSSVKPGAQHEAKTESTCDSGLLIVNDKCDNREESSASNPFMMTNLNSDNRQIEVKDSERMYLQRRTGTKMGELSNSEKEGTNTEYEKSEKDTSVASGQRSERNRERLNRTENSSKYDTNQSIELFSDKFQSNNPNTSRDLHPTKECTDTEDENVGHPTDVRMNENVMIADDETTGVEDSDNEQCFSDRKFYGDKSPKCTPEKKEGKLSTPPLSHEVARQESMIAARLFSPGFRKASEILTSRLPWICTGCNTKNEGICNDCEGCLAHRPENTLKEETRIVNIDDVPVYKQFHFSCSMNTARVYLYDKDCEPLHMNFLPADVQMDNLSELPEVLLHPENFKLAKRFVREWNSLTATKRRMVIRSGAVFANPCLLYQDIRTGKKPSKERYTSKSSGANTAIAKASEIGGSLRVLTRPIYKEIQRNKEKKNDRSTLFDQGKSAEKVNENEVGKLIPNDKEFLDWMKGIVQVLDKNGNPLCIHCQTTCQTQLVSKETLNVHSWHTRFCSKKCMEEYWITHHRGYSRQQVFEAERGICQKCNFDCQNFYERIRITKDMAKRARLIQESHYGCLASKVKEKMTRTPQSGLFWHADHITPVAQGGGECDIDNLRTLCTVCHRNVTADQQRNKAAARRLEAAAIHTDIKSFFQSSSK